jgi:acetylornithine deacetylase/succinyl-diaminopimelate desuccinylase-like protein
LPLTRCLSPRIFRDSPFNEESRMQTSPVRRRPIRRFIAATIFTTALVALPGTISAQRPADLAKLQDEAVQHLQQYLRINTANPPGNEAEAMRFFARILAREGIPFDTAVPAPGRGNIWARLKGGSEPALLLLHHMDVVPADPRYWDVDPYSGTLRGGDVFGRGALDTKALGIVQLQAFLALKRSGAALNRDVVFMATADEEAGGAFGAGWIVKNRPDAFRGTGLVLNEGGSGTALGDLQQFGIEVTQKVPLWLKLVSAGRPGHGSAPPVETAVTRLIRALDRVQTHEFAPRIVPAVDAYFKGLAKNAPAPWKDVFADMGRAVQDRQTLLRLQLEQPGSAALTRNACSITMLEGSNKINVIPTEASAQIDCRLLPDQNKDAFLDELRGVINDATIRIEEIMAFTPAVSPMNNPLYQAIAEVTQKHFPRANVVPLVQTGFTDSHFFRDLGIASYGYGPFLIPADQSGGVHGNNERISELNMRRGTQVMLEIVERVVKGTVVP